MYRLTVDYWPINAATVNNTWPMPHIHAVLQELRGSEAFVAMDFTSGYCKLPVHPESPPLHAFNHPDGVLQPPMNTQGGLKSASNFQACLEPCFSYLRENLLAWLDDVSIHDRTEAVLLRILEKFLDACQRYRLVVSLPKSTFYTSALIWRGRSIDSSGVLMDPASYDGIKDCADPTNTA